jgi:hypothetical protein
LRRSIGGLFGKLFRPDGFRNRNPSASALISLAIYNRDKLPLFHIATTGKQTNMDMVASLRRTAYF